MAIFIPHRCPKYFESVTLIQPQYKAAPAHSHLCLGVEPIPYILRGNTIITTRFRQHDAYSQFSPNFK